MKIRGWLQESYARLAKTRLRQSTLSTLLYLLSAANESGQVTISRQEIADALGCDTRTVFTALKELTSLHFLSEVEKKAGSANTYSLHPKIVRTCLQIPVPDEPDRAPEASEGTQTWVLVPLRKTASGQTIAPNIAQATEGYDLSRATHDQMIITPHDRLIIPTPARQLDDREIIPTHDQPIIGSDQPIIGCAEKAETPARTQPVAREAAVTDVVRPNHPLPPSLEEIGSGKAGADYLGAIGRKQRRLLLAEGYKYSMEPVLTVVARVHGQTAALEAEIPEIVSRMQRVTVALWELDYKSPADVESLGAAWYSESSFGKKGAPPSGMQLVEFASQQRTRIRKPSPYSPSPSLPGSSTSDNGSGEAIRPVGFTNPFAPPPTKPGHKPNGSTK